MAATAVDEQRSSPAKATTLVGRHEEIAALSAVLTEAEGGHGVTALITGPGGIGKTSLVRWLEDVARSHNLWVRWGYCLPELHEPFFPMEQIFRSNGKDEQEGRGKGSGGSKGLPLAFIPLKGQATSGLRRGMGQGPGWNESEGDARPMETPLAFVPLDKETAQGGDKERPMDASLAFMPLSKETARSSFTSRAPANVLLDYLSRIENESTEHPCVIFLDDFQWADPDSVQALRFLSRNIKRMPVLIVVTMREDEVKDPSFQEALSEMRRGGLVKDVPLAGLREKEAQQLLEKAIQAPLESDKAATAVHFLVDLTGGNPYFFLETVRHLQDTGMVRMGGRKAIVEVPVGGSSGEVESIVPDSVTALLARRLETLTKDQTDLLEGASVIGHEFEVAPLQDLLGTPGGSVIRLLKELSSKRDLVVPKGEDGTKYAFAHALLWDTVRRSVPEEKRKEWAGKLASWWEAHLPADVERIATLYELGGLNAKALASVNRVIEISMQTHSHERVAKYFEIGLKMMEQEGEPVEGMTRWGLSIVDNLRGDGADHNWNTSIYRRLLQLGPPEPLSWELLARLTNEITMDQTREARQLFNKVQEATRRRPEMVSKGLLGKIAVANSWLLYFEGDSNGSIERAREALSLLPEDERLFRGLTLWHMGWVDADLSRFDEATDSLEKGLTIAKAGKLLGLTPLLLNLKGTIALMTGDNTEAESCYSEASATCRSLGQVMNRCGLLANLAQARIQMGDIDGAESAAREALRIADAFNRPYGQSCALQTLGNVMVLRKAPAAVDLFNKAKVIFEQMGNAESIFRLRLDFAEARGVLGDPSGALAELREVKDEDAPKQEDWARIHTLRGRFAMETGAKDEAKTELNRALEESRQRGLFYWVGLAMLLLSEWEKKYGSPENAAKTREESEKILGECGVVNLAVFTGERSEPAEGEEADVAETEAKPRAQLSMAILKYLHDQGGIEGAYAPNEVVPITLTQKGISEGLGLPRDRFSMVLKRLTEGGMIVAQPHNVKGESRTLKAYLLTKSGEAALKE
jgi:tetratricopeptide (TPR) repeat protein